MSILLTVLLLYLFFHVAGFFFHICGRILGIVLSLFGYVFIGALAIGLFSLSLNFLPFLLGAGLVGTLLAAKNN